MLRINHQHTYEPEADDLQLIGGTPEDGAVFRSYEQIPDTGWWEGEPDAALDIGERTYPPRVPQASLTLVAVYDAGRRPCYWLAATNGNIIERRPEPNGR